MTGKSRRVEHDGYKGFNDRRIVRGAGEFFDIKRDS
jgi:hypothetical protein